jgi:hypothetical protein
MDPPLESIMVPHDPYDSHGRREVVLEPARSIAPAEYLTFERASETKHEYDNGRVFALAGASERHNLIVSNLIISIGCTLSLADIYSGLA